MTFCVYKTKLCYAKRKTQHSATLESQTYIGFVNGSDSSSSGVNTSVAVRISVLSMERILDFLRQNMQDLTINTTSAIARKKKQNQAEF